MLCFDVKLNLLAFNYFQLIFGGKFSITYFHGFLEENFQWVFQSDDKGHPEFIDGGLKFDREMEEFIILDRTLLKRFLWLDPLGFSFHSNLIHSQAIFSGSKI